MDRLHVLALSYHNWPGMAAALFFLLFISYAVTDNKGAVSRGGNKAYGETDLKRKVYLLSKRAK
jgi:hypothetical protein